MSPRALPRRQETLCPTCEQLVGLVCTRFNTGRVTPKIARHKPVPGGPWCTGAGLAVPESHVMEATR